MSGGEAEEKKSDVARESGPPAWFGPALLEARCADLAGAGHRLAKCELCSCLLYEVEGVFIHADALPAQHVGVPTEIFDPRAQPAEPAESANCGAIEWKPTWRERLARFIFPRRHMGPFPDAALSSAVEWTQGDLMTTLVWVDVSFWDLLRLVCSRRLLCEVIIATEFKPGRTASLSAISVLPPQLLEPGPSGNWSPEDERDLFDLLAGVGGQAPEHPCALCTHPDCFKGYLPGSFGEPGMGDACPECLAAGRLDVWSEDWKMTPRELALQRAATGDHVGGAFVVRDGETIWAPAGGPVQSVGPQSSSGEPGAEGWCGECDHERCRQLREIAEARMRAEEFRDGPQSPTGTKCIVCGIDCSDAPRGFVRGAPIGETPALWQCPEHLGGRGVWTPPPVWTPTPDGTICSHCKTPIIGEACRCSIRGPVHGQIVAQAKVVIPSPLLPKSQVYGPMKKGCVACGEIIGEACRCGVRGVEGKAGMKTCDQSNGFWLFFNEPGPHPAGAPATELARGEIMACGDRLSDGEPIPEEWLGLPVKADGVFRDVPLGEPSGVEGEEGRPK